MFEILDNLYLASYSDLEILDPEIFKFNTSNISNIDKNDYKLREIQDLSEVFLVNCTKDVQMFHENSVRVYVNDNYQEESFNIMYKSFSYISELIDSELKKNKKVIIYSYAGRQRAPTIICGYLMMKLEYSLDKSIEFLKFKKADSFLGQINFIKSLEKLETLILLDNFTKIL